MNCSQCGAALAINSPVCTHCGTTNALDLLAVSEYRASPTLSNLSCPNGCGHLRSYKLGKLRFIVLHCEHCKGMLLRNGVLEDILQDIHEQVSEKNRERIVMLATHRVSHYQQVNRPCPVCGSTMKSTQFRPDFPLQLEHCSHGVWLDNGELTVLAEWSESGGNLDDAFLPEPPISAFPKATSQAKAKTLNDPSNAFFGNLLFGLGMLGTMATIRWNYALGLKVSSETPDFVAILLLLAAPLWLVPLALLMRKGLNLKKITGIKNGYTLEVVLTVLISWFGLFCASPSLAIKALPVGILMAVIIGAILNRILNKEDK